MQRPFLLHVYEILGGWRCTQIFQPLREPLRQLHQLHERAGQHQDPAEPMKEQITIIGDGAMGLVCAMILSRNGHDVTLWTAFPEAVQELRLLRGNPRRLPDAALPAGVNITADDATCFVGATLAVSAVPGQYVRSV